jgi:hypothetical protein
LEEPAASIVRVNDGPTQQVHPEALVSTTRLHDVVFQKTVLDTHCCGFPVCQFSIKKSKMIMDKCPGASLFADMPPLFHSSHIQRVCMSEIRYIPTVTNIWINYCTTVLNHFMHLRLILSSLITLWQCGERSTVLTSFEFHLTALH